MRVKRGKTETVIILENQEEEFKMEQVLAYFEKPEPEEDMTEEMANSFEDFGNDVNAKLNHWDFGKGKTLII